MSGGRGIDYGFKFQSAAHREAPRKRPGAFAWEGEEQSAGGSSLYSVGDWAQAPQQVKVEKSATEKQADVLEYLKGRPDRRPAAAPDILAFTGIDLEGADIEVKLMLQSNPKVETQGQGDQTAYVYYGRYNVSNQSELLHLIGRCTSGISKSDLLDTYESAEQDLDAMIRAGDVIAIKHQQQGGVHLYPRGPKFLTRLSGIVQCREGSKVADTTAPLALELKRGEAVRLGDFWTRVSCEVSTAGPHNQPKRAAPPDSVTTDKERSLHNVYTYEFVPEQLTLPLQTPYESTQQQQQLMYGNSSGKSEYGAAPAPMMSGYQGAAVRHGASQRVRELWRKTLEELPKDDDHKLHDMLFKAGLTSSAAGAQKRAKRFHSTGPTKRESQRSQKLKRIAVVNSSKLTNDHLQGTAIGALMEAARLNPEMFNNTK